MIRPKLAICIPTVDGKISAWTVHSLLGLYPPVAFLDSMRPVSPSLDDPAARKIRGETWEKLLPFEILDTWMWDRGVVVVRGRAVRQMLESDATHLLFVDADVSFSPAVIRTLLAIDRPIVGVPYPKREIHWDRMYDAIRAGRPSEEGAYEYVLHTGGEPEEVDRDGCLDVQGLGMGCTLLRRDCLERMTRAYGEGSGNEINSLGESPENLAFYDTHPTMGGPTVELFAHLATRIDGRDVLLSEDLSFCARWRALGGRIACYVGPGAPAGHHGSHHYHGTREGLVRAHGEKKP